MSLGCIALALASLACIALVTYREPPPRRREGTLKWSDFYESRVLSLSFQILVMSFGYGGILALITLHFRASGSKSTGLFYTFYALTLLLLRPLVGRLFDRQGPRLLMPIGLTALGGCYLILHSAHGVPWLLAGAVVLGVGYSIVQPIVMAMALQRVPRDRHGAANSNLFTALDLGVAAGSLLLSLVADRHGIRPAFLLCALSNLLTLASFHLFDTRRRAPGDPAAGSSRDALTGSEGPPGPP